MPRTASEKPLKKTALRLFESDLNYLKIAYPASGYNIIVRALVARHVKNLRNATIERLEIKLTTEELESV